MTKVGKVITVTSRKGGVGKTTTILNLAGCYSNLGKKILIIDFDLYTNSVAVSLDIDSKKNILNLVNDINNNNYKDIKNYVYEYNSNISVLCGIKDPRQTNLINLKYIEQIINYARYSYDIVLIDTCHILIDLNAIIFDFSNILLNITSNDPVDLVNTKTFINIVNDVKFNDLRILVNESCDLEDKYFSMYDIKNFLDYPIRYRLDKNLFVKAIDKYVLEGKILTLSKVYDKKKYSVLESIALDLIKEGDSNE